MMIYVASCSNEITRSGKVGLMWSPTAGSNMPVSFYAIDNGAYTTFHEKQFFYLLEKSKRIKKPEFIVAPDVVGCSDRTLALWKYYLPLLKPYGYPIAFVAQNGCKNIPEEADWIFVGGTDPWKMKNVERFVKIGKPVHVGRVNSMRRLEECEKLGAMSVDGSGWFRDTIDRQRGFQLKEYLHGERRQLCFQF